MSRFTTDFYKSIEKETYVSELWKVIPAGRLLEIVRVSGERDYGKEEALLYCHRNNILIGYEITYCKPLEFISNAPVLPTEEELKTGELRMPTEITDALLNLIILHYEKPSESSELRRVEVEKIINRHKPDHLTSKEYLEMLQMYNKMGVLDT